MNIEMSRYQYEQTIKDMMNSAEVLLENEEALVQNYCFRNTFLPMFIPVGGGGIRSGGRQNDENTKSMLAVGGIMVLAIGVIALLATLFEARTIGKELDKWNEYSKIITPENIKKHFDVHVLQDTNNVDDLINHIKNNVKNGREALIEKKTNKLQTIITEAKSIFKGRKIEAQINIALCIGIIMAAGLIIIGACAWPAGIGIALVVAGASLVSGIAILKITSLIFKPVYKNIQLQRIYEAADFPKQRTIIIHIGSYERMTLWSRIRYGRYF